VHLTHRGDDGQDCGGKQKRLLHVAPLRLQSLGASRS
jgi:hypothetical protein